MSTLSCISTTQVSIITGEDREFNVQIFSEDTNIPFDLTDNDEIVVRFLNADGTYLDKKKTESDVTILSATGGKIKVTLDETDTAGLALGDKQSFEIKIENGTGPDFDTRKLVISQAINVTASTF